MAPWSSLSLLGSLVINSVIPAKAKFIPIIIIVLCKKRKNLPISSPSAKVKNNSGIKYATTISTTATTIFSIAFSLEPLGIGVTTISPSPKLSSTNSASSKASPASFTENSP